MGADASRSMEPHLFEEAVDAQLERLAAEAASGQAAPGVGTEVTLYRRIEDVKRRARSQSVQDLMYFSVLRKFMSLGVDLLPPLDGRSDPGGANLASLTKGVHSADALELVREHLENALGGGSGAPPFSAQLVRMSKLQAAQVYAASLMFGYFLRRVDARFALERQAGTLPRSQEDTVRALEELFNSASAEELPPGSAAPASASAAAGPSAQDQPPDAGLVTQRTTSLRNYVRSFDAETLAATARIVSLEGVALVERQTTALFGSIDALSEEMTKAIGEGISSREEFMERMTKALESGAVQSVTLTYATQRRVVLEAVAFGSFLRDVEGRVGQGEHGHLLTPTMPHGFL
jgi:hypothetical protein